MNYALFPLNVSGILGIVGLIDGSYIEMSCPAHAEANTYVNRHNKLSSTLQCVCGPDKKFLDVFAGKLSFSSLTSFVGFTVSFHLQVAPVKSMILQFSATRTYRGNCLQSVATSSICLATQVFLFQRVGNRFNGLRFIDACLASGDSSGADIGS